MRKMTNDENIPYVPYETLSKVIPLDHYRDFQEIRDLNEEFLAALSEETLNNSANNDEKSTIASSDESIEMRNHATLPWERDLSDYGISIDDSHSPLVTAHSLSDDALYEFWTSQYSHDQKLRELYVRPKLSPIFFDDELDSLNSRLEVKLNMWDYLQRKIHYYQKLLNQK